MKRNDVQVVAERGYNPASFSDPMAKSPRALALALMRYSAIFRDGTPMAASPERLMQMHRQCMHQNLLYHGGLEADAFWGKGDTVLWVCPDILSGLRGLIDMDVVKRAKLARWCRKTDASLDTATLTNLDGSVAMDHSRMLREWAQCSLDLFEGHLVEQGVIALLRAPFENGAKDACPHCLEGIDQEFADAAALVGADHPAEIEGTFLRMTGIVDADTADLGQAGGVDIFGVAYALTLAFAARTRGLSVGCEVPKVDLQEGYARLKASAMKGHADAVMNGAARSCEEHRPGMIFFSVHRPEGILALAAALCGVMEMRGEFAAVVAASDILADGKLHGLVDHQRAQRVAEVEFVSAGCHSEDVLREILSDQLFDVLPALFDGDDREIDETPGAGRAACERLTMALKRAYPEARAICIQERHKELCRRLSI